MLKKMHEKGNKRSSNQTNESESRLPFIILLPQ